MTDVDTAQSLIASIQGQSSLLLSLTTALLGGAAALAVQLKIREGQILPLKLNWFFIFGIVLLGVSCLSSWAVLGALIDKTPVIMSLTFEGKEFSEIEQIKQATALTLMANLQFFSFIFGALLTAVGFIQLKR
ncbi:hypothetical protein [Ruegeria atlantica]|uniref:hypothetical protein n=1 Tax=Ruegeria atlantica TaxID=81569 RepID=UPI001480322B|nr:hypothetical protein [Ruegeria atlantica]